MKLFTAIILSLIVHILLLADIDTNNNIPMPAPAIASTPTNISIDIYKMSKGENNSNDIIGSDDISQQASISSKENFKKSDNAIKQKVVKKENTSKSKPQLNSKKGNNSLNSNENITAGYASFVPKPKYPISSRRNKEEGSVVIKINIDEKGKPITWEIASSSSYDRLDKEAMKVIKKAKFMPAMQNGKPVSSSINLKITFSLKEERV